MKKAAIITGPYTYLDHLGVLSSLLEIPLIVTDQNTYDLGKQFYPDIKIHLKEMHELSLGFLAEHIDILFQTGKFWAEDIVPFVKLLYNKNIRLVFCPHGNSDKGYSLTKDSQASQDICLVYGKQMHDHLKKTGALEKTRKVIATGNYRLSYYLKHQEFYDTLTDSLVFSRLDSSKQTIFYAPTWSDKENTSSFFSSCDKLVEALTPTFNLLIKLHPFLEENHPAHTYHLLSKYENKPGVFILNNFPAIYPLLNKTSIYLGDYSSIGYDFLAFDKPLYFLHPKKVPLSSSGMVIPEKENPLTFIQNTLTQNTEEFSPKRKSLYNYAFEKSDFSHDFG